MVRILASALAGGAVLFVWSSIYWAASGIPIRPIHTFRDEAAVEKCLRDNVTVPGYYVLPTPHVEGGAEGATLRMKKVSQGFFFAGTVRPGGLGSFPAELGLAFFGNFVSAAIMAVLMMSARGTTLSQRVMMSVLGGLYAGVTCQHPQIVWWGYPPEWALYWIFDLVVGWTLAGLVIGKIMDPIAREPAAR